MEVAKLEELKKKRHLKSMTRGEFASGFFVFLKDSDFKQFPFPFAIVISQSGTNP